MRVHAIQRYPIPTRAFAGPVATPYTHDRPLPSSLPISALPSIASLVAAAEAADSAAATTTAAARAAAVAAAACHHYGPRIVAAACPGVVTLHRLAPTGPAAESLLARAAAAAPSPGPSWPGGCVAGPG